MMRKQITVSLLAAILCIAASARPAQKSSLSISGQVLDAEGNPVSNANVYAYPVGPLSGRLPSASTDKDGRFTIRIDQAGRYTVAASKMADGYANTYSAFYNAPGNSLPEVVVEENQASPVVTIQLGPKAGKLIARILDAQTNQAVKEVQINLCLMETPPQCQRYAVQEPLKHPSILVPPAPLNIQVSAPGYKVWDGSRELSGPLQIAAGTTQELFITLQRLSADEDENQYPGRLEAPVQISPIDGAELDYFPRVTRLEWSAVEGAVSYSVEVDFCNGDDRTATECREPKPLQYRQNPPPSGIKATSYEFTFIGAQPGRWRVWAVDAQGRAGAKSAWAVFFYKQ